MQRDRIDVAIHAKLDRQLRLLRDVSRSGGRDNFDHLKSHGHHHATIATAVQSGYLKEPARRRYELTESGRRYLADIDDVRLRAA